VSLPALETGGSRLVGRRITPRYPPWRQALFVSLLLATAAILASGCSNESFHNPQAYNATFETIELYLVHDGQGLLLGKIASRSALWVGAQDSCIKETMIARSVSGKEIARRDVPLCPYQTWTIGP
jgi:hypothetical protein